MELNICARAAMQYFSKLAITVAKAATGTFISSLDMNGISMTVLKVTGEKMCAPVPSLADLV